MFGFYIKVDTQKFNSDFKNIISKIKKFSSLEYMNIEKPLNDAADILEQRRKSMMSKMSADASRYKNNSETFDSKKDLYQKSSKFPNSKYINKTNYSNKLSNSKSQFDNLKMDSMTRNTIGGRSGMNTAASDMMRSNSGQTSMNSGGWVKSGSVQTGSIQRGSVTREVSSSSNSAQISIMISFPSSINHIPYSAFQVSDSEIQKINSIFYEWISNKIQGA